MRGAEIQKIRFLPRFFACLREMLTFVPTHQRIFRRMKKYLLLLFALCAFTACSDDDNVSDLTNEEMAAAVDPYGKNTDEGMAAYCALSLLCDLDSLPDNWKTATFEPTYGYAVDAASPYVRTIYVESILDAEDCFRSLGGTIESGQASATYTAGNISYQYTAKNQSDLFATIDCTIPQIPTLSQLRFVPSEVQGDNALFYPWKASDENNLRYTVGDVVQRLSDGTFWVCVRQARYKKKHKTYWVAPVVSSGTVNKDEFFPNTGERVYIKEYAKTSSHGDYYVPTKLSTSVDLIRNFIILINALAKDEDVAYRNPGLSADCADYVYTDKSKVYYYCFGLQYKKGEEKEVPITNQTIKNIREAWDEEQYSYIEGENDQSIYSLLGLTHSVYTTTPRSGFAVFYKGYSSFGWSMTLWTVMLSPYSFWTDTDGDTYEASFDMDTHIVPREHYWKMTDAKGFNIYRYFENNGCWEGAFKYNLSFDVNVIEPLPTNAFILFDMEYDGDPTQEMDGVREIYRYKDLEEQNKDAKSKAKTKTK